MPDKSKEAVINMFSKISKRYDLGNDLLTFGLHRLWESKAISMLPEDNRYLCLDLCTGTGALLPKLSEKYHQVIGGDFCIEMLNVAKERHVSLLERNVSLVEVDALNLPYQDNKFDIITIAYGVRNFSNLEQGLKELRRVLKPEGALMILEIGTPTNWFKPFYKFYSKFIIPLIGELVTGDRAAYIYLPDTVKSFPSGYEFEEKLKQASFSLKETKTFLFGSTYVYLSR